MDMNSIIKNTIRRWWIVLIIFLLTLVVTTYLNQKQRTVYESSSTFITNPSQQVAEDRTLTSVLAMMNRDNEIITTIAEVAKSSTIRNLASIDMGLSPEELDPMVVKSRIIAGTNILQISVAGPDPILVQKFTERIGEETISFANTVYPAYQLKVLDTATMPWDTSRNPLAFNLVLSSALGLFFGVGAAMFASWANTVHGRGDELPDLSSPVEPDIQAELVAARHQIIVLRKELYETRMILKDTLIEAKAVASSLHKLSNQNNSKVNEKVIRR